MAHRLIVSGALACFRRPEIGGDAVSYDVITPIAARRIFEAVHWTPAIIWQIERIEVLRPIQIESRSVAGERVLALVDVSYALHARFELTPACDADDSPGKHSQMFRRRARQRAFSRPPFLGQRGMVAQVDAVDAAYIPPSAYRGSGTIDLGWMIRDRAVEGAPRHGFYRPLMIDGVIDCGSVPPERLAG